MNTWWSHVSRGENVQYRILSFSFIIFQNNNKRRKVYFIRKIFFSSENLFLVKFSTTYLNKEFLTNKNIDKIRDAKYFFIKISIFGYHLLYLAITKRHIQEILARNINKCVKHEEHFNMCVTTNWY